MFVEHDRSLVNPDGRVGMICPSGIATDDTTKELFQDFVLRQSLVALFDFDTSGGLFTGVGHGRFKFCILVLAAPGGGPKEADLSFFNNQVGQIRDPRRRFTLSLEDFKLINPNTLTCPTFRTYRDAELTRKLYQNSGAFVLENDVAGNPWGVSFMRMFDMSNDSKLFCSKDPLENDGFVLQGNQFKNGSESFLPLYEAKLAHQFTHRWGDYAMRLEGSLDSELPRIPEEKLADPNHMISPRYWLPRDAVEERLKQRDKNGSLIWEWTRDWMLGFRDITNATNERTAIFSLLPRVGVGHKMPLIFLEHGALFAACFLANLDSLILDFSARQKVGGTSFGYFILKQLPVLPPSTYPRISVGHLDWLEIIVPKVLELVYTAWDLAGFANDVLEDASPELTEAINQQFADNSGHPLEPPDWLDITPQLAPFRWDDDRRAKLRAELDAIYAHLYKLTRDELRWVLDPRDVDPETPSVTFPGLRRNEEKAFGEYRTKRLVLEYFDAWTERLQTTEEIFETTVRA